MFSSLLCFIRNKDYKLYKKSKKVLYEYIDLKHVIAGLQDVDKLKNVLLTESEKFFFDLIPNPEIAEENNENKKLQFGIDKIIKTKLKKTSQLQIQANLEKKNNFSPIQKRIFSLIDEETKGKLKIKNYNLFSVALKEGKERSIIKINNSNF